MSTRLVVETFTLAELEAEFQRREAEELADLNRLLAEASLFEFVQQAWHVLEPTTPLSTGWHMEAICLHLEAVARGEIQLLLINVPPGHAKSLLVNVFFPAWVWLKKPSWRVLFATYAQQLTERDSGKCRDLIQSQWYQETFTPDWKLSEDQNTKAFFTNTKGGFRIALSADGQGTGYRGDCVCGDDIISAEEAYSEATRKRRIRWWDKTMSTRLSHPKTGCKLLIGQRLHQEDPYGHVLGKKTYQHLNLPTEFNSKKKTITYAQKVDKTGLKYKEKLWEDPRQEDGELLFVALFDAEVIAQAKIDLGTDGFSAQHNQEPSDPLGSLFKKAHWRFWRPVDAAGLGTAPRPDGCNNSLAVVLPALEFACISLDAAFKDKVTSDYVVFTVWGCVKADRYLLDVSRDKMSFTKCVEVFKDLVKRYPSAYARLVEDKANGTAIIDTLKQEIDGLIAVEPHGGKYARAAAVQPKCESGNVYLPEGAPFLADFVEEMGAFPSGKNDDQVDSTSQALLYLSGNTDLAGFLGMVNM